MFAGWSVCLADSDGRTHRYRQYIHLNASSGKRQACVCDVKIKGPQVIAGLVSLQLCNDLLYNGE